MQGRSIQFWEVALLTLGFTVVAWGQAASQPTTVPATATVGASPTVPQVNSSLSENRAPNDIRLGVGQVGQSATGGTSSAGSKSNGTNGSTLMLAPKQDAAIPGFVPGMNMGNPPDISPSDTGQPALGGTSTTRPAAPSATATPEFKSKDPLFQPTAIKFGDADYKGCIEDLRNVVRSGQASVECHQLYIAALVGDNQITQASYQAMIAAKAFPKTFFTMHPLEPTYRHHFELQAHFEAVKNFSKESTTLQPGILWALYLQIKGADDTEVGVALDLLHPKEADREWFFEPVATMKKSPVTRKGGNSKTGS